MVVNRHNRLALGQAQATAVEATLMYDGGNRHARQGNGQTLPAKATRLQALFEASNTCRVPNVVRTGMSGLQKNARLSRETP